MAENDSGGDDECESRGAHDGSFLVLGKIDGRELISNRFTTL